MKYNNINELDARIENIIKKTVENYYTDWKNYDRPKYMRFKGSADQDDKKLILLARRYGTYLIKTADIKAGDDWATTLYNYYQDQERTTYYYIDLETLECKKIDPATYKVA